MTDEMPSPLADQLDGLTDALASNDPLDVVEAAVELRDHLDEMIRAHVTLARSIGESWNEIGYALAVSRASAWQKYHTAADVPEELAQQLFQAEVKALVAERDAKVAQTRAEVLRSGGSAEEADQRVADLNQEYLRKASPLLEAHLRRLAEARETRKQLTAGPEAAS